MKVSSLVFLLIYCFSVNGQNHKTEVFKIFSSNTSFPDTGRRNGHVYHNELYKEAQHYRDSSVIIIVPPTFRKSNSVNLIFWFHGWNNNIDTALNYYHLLRQFEESKLNAVLVLAETARNAPDSYGGKLEQKGVFKSLISDILNKLIIEKHLKRNYRFGNVLIAGHSGAYRVISGILQMGNVPISEVILFDALYAKTEEFINWIKADPSHRFINLFTNNGGTLSESNQMIETLAKEKISFKTLEESETSNFILNSNNILFIHSNHEHNDIIFNPDNFKLYLENSNLKK